MKHFKNIELIEAVAGRPFYPKSSRGMNITASALNSPASTALEQEFGWKFRAPGPRGKAPEIQPGEIADNTHPRRR